MKLDENYYLADMLRKNEPCALAFRSVMTLNAGSTGALTCSELMPSESEATTTVL